MTVHFSKMFLATGLAAVGASLAIATTRAGAEEKDIAGPTTLAEVRPTLADLMTLAQLRHFKLNYAHQVGNWELAAYELDKLEETFVRTARLYPTAAAVAQSIIIDTKTKPALSEIRLAISSKNTASFKSAYTALTVACNQCHAAANVAFISIKIPTKSPFSNQMFAPPR